MCRLSVEISAGSENSLSSFWKNSLLCKYSSCQKLISRIKLQNIRNDVEVVYFLFPIVYWFK